MRVKTGNASSFHALFEFDLHSFDLKTFSVSKIILFSTIREDLTTSWKFCYFSFTDWFTVLDYDVIFTTPSNEYKAKQNHYCELGVLPKFQSKNFLKYKNILPLTILRVRNDFVATLSRRLFNNMNFTFGDNYCKYVQEWKSCYYSTHLCNSLE